jgi:6-phosphogluconolactonase
MPSSIIKTIWPNALAVSQAAATIIVVECNKAIANKGYCTIALSGGSTPKVLYELLATPTFAKNIHWKKVFIFFGDERFVPHNSEESNYKMATDTLLVNVPIPKKNIFGIQTQNITPQQSAKSYNAVVKKYVTATHPFDIVLLGIGEEGHTASLFPNSPLLKETKSWVQHIFVTEKKMERITFTLPLINKANNVLFLVSGASKAAIVKTIFSAKGKKLPAAMVQPKGNLFWVLDEAAAAAFKIVARVDNLFKSI